MIRGNYEVIVTITLHCTEYLVNVEVFRKDQYGGWRHVKWEDDNRFSVYKMEGGHWWAGTPGGGRTRKTKKECKAHIEDWILTNDYDTPSKMTAVEHQIARETGEY